MHFFLSLMISLGIVAIAILSVQNATAVTIQFFAWQSVELPLGIVLTFAFALGLLIVALIRPVWALTTSPRPQRAVNSTYRSTAFSDPGDEDWV